MILHRKFLAVLLFVHSFFFSIVFCTEAMEIPISNLGIINFISFAFMKCLMIYSLASPLLWLFSLFTFQTLLKKDDVIQNYFLIGASPRHLAKKFLKFWAPCYLIVLISILIFSPQTNKTYSQILNLKLKKWNNNFSHYLNLSTWTFENNSFFYISKTKGLDQYSVQKYPLTSSKVESHVDFSEKNIPKSLSAKIKSTLQKIKLRYTNTFSLDEILPHLKKPVFFSEAVSRFQASVFAFFLFVLFSFFSFTEAQKVNEKAFSPLWALAIYGISQQLILASFGSQITSSILVIFTWGFLLFYSLNFRKNQA